MIIISLFELLEELNQERKDKTKCIQNSSHKNYRIYSEDSKYLLPVQNRLIQLNHYTLNKNFNQIPFTFQYLIIKNLKLKIIGILSLILYKKT